ncbi:MAG: glycosyltransferase [Chloroflexota bacterium]|nr:MAG: glycosyltransferase [Chloroflexota bacterium]
MTPDLSVIIVSYNTRSLVEGCLRALPSSCRPTSPVEYDTRPELAIEVIVVDNASADNTVDVLTRDYPSVQLIANAQNRGFAAATNQGLLCASGRHVLLLNPDTEPRPAALYRLVRFLDEHPSVGAVGARLLNTDGSFQHGCFRFPSLAMSFLDFFPINHRLTNSRLNGRYPQHWYDKPFPIDHPLGACLMMRREAFADVGPLDEQFFIYCEEVDWCIRIKRAGWSIYCVPDAEVVHFGAQSTTPRWNTMFVELHRSRYRLFRKHYSRPFQSMARLITRAGVLRDMFRLRRSYRKGSLSEDEYNRRMKTYRQVLAL